MTNFEIFGKKTPAAVTAHILDPKFGYSKQTWAVGQHVSREAVEKLSEDGSIFVVVAYEAGTPKQVICRRDIWDQTKEQFGYIEATGQASLRQIMDEINKPVLHEPSPYGYGEKIVRLTPSQKQERESTPIDDTDADVQYQKGIMFECAEGVEQDYEQAAFWFEKSALQGHAGAQISLGILFNDGRGVARDYKRAMELWGQAAAQGDAIAQYNLGDMYSECRGVLQDYVEELKWFSLAADSGDPDAAKCRDIVEAKMTRQQVAEARRRARDWSKAHRQPTAGSETNMNVWNQSVEWLFREQLKVDDEWACRTPSGFKWWADKYAQTIEVLGQEIGPDGDVGYFISVRTDFLRDLELTGSSMVKINALLMPFAAMTGPVYDAEKRTLNLCSLVRVHKGISGWMNPLISVAAILQLAEATIMGSAFAKALNAHEAESGHPEHGMRPHPDEMADAVANLILPLGKQQCKWTETEFQDVVDNYMQQPPSLCATAGGLGCTVEFPFGDGSSLCQMKGSEPHPRYGNGLFLLQSFPVDTMSDADGAKLALSLNATELAKKPSGYGFGSFAYGDGSIHFTSFLPNAVYRPGLLPNLYFACAGRAKEMSVRLAGHDWNKDSFDPRRSGMGRMIDRAKGTSMATDGKNRAYTGSSAPEAHNFDSLRALQQMQQLKLKPWWPH